MTPAEAKAKVLAVYPDAEFCMVYGVRPAIYSECDAADGPFKGEGPTEDAAWLDAASRMGGEQ